MFCLSLLTFMILAWAVGRRLRLGWKRFSYQLVVFYLCTLMTMFMTILTQGSRTHLRGAERMLRPRSPYRVAAIAATLMVGISALVLICP